ncbi:hypothetical protein V5799_023500 [Amblyomma americanum]|uniref:Cytochrome n=1 Tax=Amblyomma americanum TaxID=6943 RepID=A0AAQ4FHF5_AMBAM
MNSASERRPRIQDKEQLPFTMACVLEILRLYPPALLGLPHRAQSTERLGGVVVPKGAMVLYNVMKANRDPSLWDDPCTFKPERFLDGVKGALRTKDLPPVLSFGVGPRSCVGEKLVPTVLFYVLVRLMQRTSWSLPESCCEDPARCDGTTLLLAPAERRVLLTKRSA